MPEVKHSRRRVGLPLLLVVLVTALLLYRFGSGWLRHLLIYLSQAVWARRLISELPLARGVAGRFVAGETIEEAMRTAREMNQQGMRVSLDYLGESVTDAAEARAARDEIMRLLDRIEATGVDANVSVKLTQLGLKIDPALALENLRCIVERAREYGNRVRIDMEDSPTVDVTLDIYRRLRDEAGFGNSVGVVIQAYLYRSEEDVRRLIEKGAWVRLCKGAYLEPPEIAFPVKADTDANYVKLMALLLSETARRNGVYPGIATHDEKMIAATKEYARANGIRPAEYEFQMLYGIRRELQRELVEQGYQLRVYIPYGTAWYPYFMRRLAERPANLWFFVSNLVRA